MISKPMVRLVQTMHLSCTNTNTVSKTDRNKIPHGPRYQGVPLGVSKMTSEPKVRSAQTVHLSCVKISIISKRTKSCFHLSLVTYEYHWVHRKWFLSQWYVWCKPCTYLAPTLTLSQNRMKRDSTWPKSPGSYIGYIQDDFWACGMFSAKRAPILRQD
jgi:hypothetical protein